MKEKRRNWLQKPPKIDPRALRDAAAKAGVGLRDAARRALAEWLEGLTS